MVGMNKFSICALAKNENAYINEWVKHHVDLGVDFIYLYDNNDSSTPFVGDCIDPAYRDKVMIINRNDENLRTRQQTIYNDWIKEHYLETEYCAFIDIDEFIVTDSLSGLVAKMPSDCNIMVLNWVNYGDDNIIEGDESQPVRKRFTKPAYKNSAFWNRTVKSILRCDPDKSFVALNAHGFKQRHAKQTSYCDCNGDHVRLISSLKFAVDAFTHHESYIEHYSTKSLSEYLKYKANRIGVVWNTDTGKVSYFFRVNIKTPEKLQYIADYYADTCNG